MSKENEEGSFADPNKIEKETPEKPTQDYPLFKKLDRIVENIEKQTQALINLTEAINNLLTSFIVKSDKVEPKPIESRPQVSTPQTEWTKPSPQLKFNVKNITWEDREGDKGKFEIAEKIKNQNVDYAELEKLLKFSGGGMPSEGFWYWLFQDGNAIGRKLSKGSFKKKEEPQTQQTLTKPETPPLPQPTSERKPQSKLDEVKFLFPEDLESMLSFEDKTDYIIIKPRQFLGSENFAKIASAVRGAGGDYVSAGKESHFRIPIKK